MPVNGKCQMATKIGAKAINAEFYVVEINEAKPLIGLQTCRDLELISINNIGELNENQPDLLTQYEDVFTGLGLVEGEYHIEVSPDVKPTIHPPRKVPLSLMPKLQETLEKLTTQGVVSKLDRATDWVNSLVIIHLIHKWRSARKSLGQVHESEAKGASDSNENKAEYGNASSISCNS